MEFIYFLLCLAERRLRGKSLGYRLAFHPARQAEVWAVAGIIVFGAMAAGFTAFSRRGRDRASAEIAEGGKMAEQLSPFGLQLRQRVGHGGSPSLSVYRR
jgi:hypothetical protein